MPLRMARSMLMPLHQSNRALIASNREHDSNPTIENENSLCGVGLSRGFLRALRFLQAVQKIRRALCV
jgi:hypothetical protein